MQRLKQIAIVCGIAGLAGCVAPVGPVEVTRFHVADATALGKGPIRVEPAPGTDSQSPEWEAYRIAVLRQLTLAGYVEAAPGADPLAGVQVAQLRLGRSTIQPARNASPVRVGMGGNTGSYGTNVGVGVGFDLSPRPAQQVETRLSVTIRGGNSDAVLWEGRASFTVRASSPLADTALGAPKLAEALFRGFPGQSGETILIK